MLAPALAIWTILAASPPDVPMDRGAELTRLLGSRLFQAREAAETELLQLGRGAIPSLRIAKRSRDLEVQLRAGAILERIEGNLLLEPTAIRLGCRNMPLAELVERIREESGIALSLLPSTPDDWQSRIVTIEEARPLPFWTAIDRLCEEAGLHYVLGASAAGSQIYEPVFVLFDRRAPRPEAIDDAGPIRVQLSVIQNAAFPSMAVGGPQPGLPFREGPVGRFERRPTPPSSSGQTQPTALQFHFIAEPRLAILNNGPIRIIEAVDQRGNLLSASAGNGPGAFPTSYYGTTPQHSLRLMQALNLPRDKETVIKRLRGTLPVQLASRKSDPLSVKLPEDVGRTFKNEETTLTVQALQTRSPQTPITSMELVLKTQRSSVAALPANEFEMASFRPELSPQQLEVTDAAGRVMSWYPSAVRSDGDATRVTLMFAVNANNQTPARVRFHGLTRTTTELEFSFHDVILK